MNVFQISLSAFVGPNLVYFTLVVWVYPMKDYIGEAGCHMMNSYRLAGAFGVQLQSLFVAIFRYICLFHGSSMRRVNLSPHVSCAAFLTPIMFSFWKYLPTLKLDIIYSCSLNSVFIFQALAKLIFLINYFLPLLSFFVFQIEHTVLLDVCLGKGYFYFFSTQSDLCFYDSNYQKGACWSLLILYAIGCSNILDAYVIFCCAKEIKKSTEKQKQSIGLQAYINRKR